MTKLTTKQQQVLGYIQRYISQHRCGPFIREIQIECQITSYKSTVDRLNALERKGFIKRTPNRHRGIRLAGSAKRGFIQSSAEPAADTEVSPMALNAPFAQTPQGSPRQPEWVS